MSFVNFVSEFHFYLGILKSSFFFKFLGKNIKLLKSDSAI